MPRPDKPKKPAKVQVARVKHVRRLRRGPTTRSQALHRLNNQGRIFLNLLTYPSPRQVS